MPRLEGDLLARDPAKLVDALNKESEASNTALYKIWIPAANFHWRSGMADHIPIGSAAYALKMGKDSSVVACIRVDETWVNGKVYATIYYSGDNSTGSYAVEVDCLPLAAGADMTGAATTISATLAAPSSANVVVESSRAGSVTVDASDDVMFVQFGRISTGDTNSGNLHFMGLMVQFWPSRVA